MKSKSRKKSIRRIAMIMAAVMLMMGFTGCKKPSDPVSGSSGESSGVEEEGTAIDIMKDTVSLVSNLTGGIWSMGTTPAGEGTFTAFEDYSSSSQLWKTDRDENVNIRLKDGRLIARTSQATAAAVSCSSDGVQKRLIGRIRPKDDKTVFTVQVYEDGKKVQEENNLTDVYTVDYEGGEGASQLVVTVLVTQGANNSGCILEDFMACPTQDVAYVAELEDGGIKAAIDTRTSRLVSLADSDGTRLLTGSHDIYEIFYEGRDEFTVTESSLTVSECMRTSTSLTFTCSSPMLQEKNIEMKIRYSFEDGHLEKEAAFLNKGSENWFAATKAGVYTDMALRQDSYYYVPWPTAEPLIRTGSVLDTRRLASQIYAPHSTTVTGLYNPEKNVTVTSTLFKQNGIYAGWSYTQPHEMNKTWQVEQPLLTSYGWEHRTNRMALRQNEENAFSVAYFITKGDSTSFLDAYLDTSAVKDIVKDIKPASWLKDVKFTQYIIPYWQYLMPLDNEGMAYFRELQKIVDEMGEGYIMSLFNYYGWQGGDFYTEDEVKYQGTGIKYFHKKYPQIKIGTFTQHFVAPQSDIFKAHPDWCIKAADGHYIHGYHPEPPQYPDGRYIFQYAIPEVITRMGEDFGKVMDVMEPDFIYNESNEAAFGWWFDYGNDQVFTGEQNRQWLQQFTDQLYAKGEDKVHWLNDPDGMICDFVQLELPSGVWSIGTPRWPNWRSMSDSAYYTKLKQQKLYDGDFNLTYAYENDKYLSYCLAYGAKPNFTANASHEVAVIAKYIPYINAIYELRHGKLLTNAEVAPNWRRDDTVQTDVVAMSLGDNSAILTAIYHELGTSTQNITADAAALGIDSDKPVFIWEYKLTNPGPTDDQFQTGNTGYRVLPERNPDDPAAERVSFQMTEVKDGRIGSEMELEQWKAGFLNITNTPGFVVSSDDYECCFSLPENMHVRLSGELDGKAVSMQAEVEAETAKIAVYLPEKGGEVKVDGSSVTYETMELDGSSFAVIELAKGSHSISA